MSSQDRVERTLKDIHVMFAQCKSLDGQPNQVVVDRKKFLKLLDDLSHGIYDMMEEYEHTRDSRARGEVAFQKQGQQIIDNASQKAEDIYAASVLYSAETVGEVQKLIDQTSDSMNELFRSFRRELMGEKEKLGKNELELESQLQDLADTRLYQGMLEDIRAEQRRRSDEEKSADSRERSEEFRKRSQQVFNPVYSANVRVNEDYFSKAGLDSGDAGLSLNAQKPEKPEVKVNYDSPYFRRKAREGQPEEMESGTASPLTGNEGGGISDAQKAEAVMRAQAQIREEPEAGTEAGEDRLHEALQGFSSVKQEEELQREILSEAVSGVDGEEGGSPSADPGDGAGAEESAEGGGAAKQAGANPRDISGWKDRMKALLNEITPKDLDEK